MTYCSSPPDYSIHHFELPLVPAASPSTDPSANSSQATTHLLVAHMRYINSTSLDDFKRDMAKIGEDPETQRWWKVSLVPGAVTLEMEKHCKPFLRSR